MAGVSELLQGSLDDRRIVLSVDDGDVTDQDPPGDVGL